MATVQSLIEGYGPNFPSLQDLFGLEPDEEQALRLSQPTPALGRYFRDVAFLGNVTSQRVVALLRFQVLIERFIFLGQIMDDYNGVHRDRRIVYGLTPTDIERLREFGRTDGDIIRAEKIERFTEHDTAAAGDYLKLLIGTQMPHLEPMIEGVAFADTSEDTMSQVFGIIANKIVFGCFVPKLVRLMLGLLGYVDFVEAQNPPLVLPGQTHQQAAEPTTFGKKITTNLAAIGYHLERMREEGGSFIPFSGKWNGAIGNFTTHLAAYPDIDWDSVSMRFIESQLGLTYEPLTFQSSTYAVEAAHFCSLANTITHLLKVVDDFLRLASCPGQLFVKRKVAGTKGSSIMPNKSNGWYQEGARKQLEKTRAALFQMAQQLPEYTHEGDMGRSFLMRDLATVFMPAFIALGRIEYEMIGDMGVRGYVPNPRKITAFFEEYPGMAGSAIQTILKRAGIGGDAYRLIEAIAINPDGTYANAEQFSQGLFRVVMENNLPADVRDELLGKLVPGANIGLADELARREGKELRERLNEYLEELADYEVPLISPPLNS